MLFPRESLLQEAHAFLSRPGENQVGAEEALSPDLAGLPLFDPPLLGISAAHDPLYATLKAPEAIGPWFLSPEEWNQGRPRCCPFSSPFPRRSSRATGRHRMPPPLPGSTAGWRGRPFSFAGPVTWSPCSRLSAGRPCVPVWTPGLPPWNTGAPTAGFLPRPPLPAGGPSATPPISAAWGPSACTKASSQNGEPAGGLSAS